MNQKYVGGKEASKILGVHQRTLYQWDSKGIIETIRTPGNKRLYNVQKFLDEKNCNNDIKCIKDLNELDKIAEKLKIGYVRVSSNGQKLDLERQKKMMTLKYPNHWIIEDVGSGVNLNRRGLRKIIKLAIEGKIAEVVVIYKDRLARFGYELIEDLIKEYSNGEIIIMNKKENMEPIEELTQDVLQIMNIFVAKMNGMRRYKEI